MKYALIDEVATCVGLLQMKWYLTVEFWRSTEVIVKEDISTQATARILVYFFWFPFLPTSMQTQQLLHYHQKTIKIPSVVFPNDSFHAHFFTIVARDYRPNEKGHVNLHTIRQMRGIFLIGLEERLLKIKWHFTLTCFVFIKARKGKTNATLRETFVFPCPAFMVS